MLGAVPDWVNWLMVIVVIPIGAIAVRNFTIVRRQEIMPARVDPDAFALAMEPVLARVNVLEAVLDDLRAQMGRYNDRISFLERQRMGGGSEG